MSAKAAAKPKSAAKPSKAHANPNAPVWLFTGPEAGEKAAEVDALRSNAEKAFAGLDNFNFYADDIKTEELVMLLQNGSLFSSGKFVVVKNADAFKLKDDVSQIVEWIASVPENKAGSEAVFLVLLSDMISIDKRIEAAVPSSHKKIFWEMFEDRKERWLDSFFKKAGLSIDEGAIRLILEMTENNTEALRAACAPFSLFYPAGTRITEKEAETILAHTREESPFTLFDALAKGDLEEALLIAGKLSLTKEAAPPQIIAGLTWCFRRLEDWHALTGGGRGEPNAAAASQAGFASNKAKAQYRMAAARWSPAATKRVLSLLAEADMQSRSSAGRLQNVSFELLLYRMLANSR